MIDRIFDKFFRNTFYIQFSAEQVSVNYVETGKTITDKPLLAFRQNQKGKKAVLAVGTDTEQFQSDPAVTICNGFSHPRVCIQDFEIAVAILRHFIIKAINKKTLVRPIIIMHPRGNLEGGLSQIEDRAIKELAAAAGARQCYVWVGETLKDIELISLSFPTHGGALVSKAKID